MKADSLMFQEQAPISQKTDITGYGPDNYVTILTELSVKLDEYFGSPKLAIYEQQEDQYR